MTESTEKQEVKPTASPFDTVEVSEQQTLVQEAAPIVEEKKVEPAVTEKKEEKAEEKKEVVKEVKVAEPTPAEIKFANEQSEKAFNLLKEGKVDELTDILLEKRTLASVDKLSPEETIKLNLKYQHPEYSQDELNDLYEEKYQRPEKPEQGEFEDDDEYKEKVAKWEKQNTKFENKLGREAKEAKKILAQKNSELVLPDITKASAEPTAEEIAEQEKLQQSYLQSLEKGLSEFSGFSTTVKDGQVELPINYAIDNEEKAALKTELQNFNVQDYFRERWISPTDNSFDGKTYAEDVYWMKNKEKILAKTASEAASQAIAKYIKEQKNIDFSGRQQQSTSQSNGKTEKEKMAEFFFSE